MTVDMREPVKDCGIRRTWPNMMTRSYGCGDARCAGGPPSHGVMLPFTRLLAGPMGCASGTFDILSECARDSVRFGLRDCMEEAGMRVNSTLAGQIADWVILYSPLQMASDRIEHYEGHPAFRFFRDFDPDCDWSRALAGEPGEYVVVVRRAGDRFYFGAATNERPRTLHFELDFLEPEVTYEAGIHAMRRTPTGGPTPRPATSRCATSPRPMRSTSCWRPAADRRFLSCRCDVSRNGAGRCARCAGGFDRRDVWKCEKSG